MAIVPPCNLCAAYRNGASRPGLLCNACAMTVCAVATALVAWQVGDVWQWCSFGLCSFGFLSWLQNLALADSAACARILGSKALVLALLAFGVNGFVGYGFMLWYAPLLIRSHNLTPSQVSAVLGPLKAICSIVGLSLFGLLSDRWQARTRKGRLLAGMLALSLTTLCDVLMVHRCCRPLRTRCCWACVAYKYIQISHRYVT
eukprot:g73880.t1